VQKRTKRVRDSRQNTETDRRTRTDQRRDVLLRASPDCVFRLSRRLDFENAQGARARLLVRVWFTRGWDGLGRDRTRRVQALGTVFVLVLISSRDEIFFSRMFFSPLSRDRRNNSRDRKNNARTRDRGKSSFDAFSRSFLLSFKTEEEEGINFPSFFPSSFRTLKEAFLDFFMIFFFRLKKTLTDILPFSLFLSPVRARVCV